MKMMESTWGLSPTVLEPESTMEAEAQPSVVDGSEVKDEVKGEEVTDDEAVTVRATR